MHFIAIVILRQLSVEHLYAVCQLYALHLSTFLFLLIELLFSGEGNQSLSRAYCVRMFAERPGRHVLDFILLTKLSGRHLSSPENSEVIFDEHLLQSAHSDSYGYWLIIFGTLYHKLEKEGGLRLNRVLNSRRCRGA